MTPFLYSLLVAIGVALLLTFVLKYADRAIRERRPGWVDPLAPDEGVRCPHATGHKGDSGAVGEEKK